jgi:imidazole glycerol-phosphate synthase subunit HisH
MNINVGVVDLNAGNVGALTNRLSELGVNYELISSPTSVEFSHIILPGVGNFNTFMKKIYNSGLSEFIIENSLIGTRIMGICVGMHALAYDSEEGDMKGLGLIPGSVKKIITRFPLPHMGWNSIKVENDNSILDDLDNSIGFYYLHNYKFEPLGESQIIASSNYGENITGIIKNKNIFGVQFHPEKSHDNGLLLLKNFININAQT